MCCISPSTPALCCCFRDVCGYPSTVHGGLTAAIVDETFGGLYTALLTTGNLGATLPGLTARLELDYKKKIPSGTVLLVTAELESVEPRKVWMKATVSNGDKSAFATGRALFVAPNIGKQLAGLFQWPKSSSRGPQQVLA
jgi:acyl-coenzyme A thioesterase PaaI-like protein